MSGALAAPTEDQAPPTPGEKSGGLHTGIHKFFFFLKQTEQCLVWNVFKEKANSFAECGETGRGSTV